MLKRKLILVLTLVLSLGLFASCGRNEANDNPPKDEPKQDTVQQVKEPETDEVSLSEWGDFHPRWESITNFYDKDYLIEEAKHHAEEDGTTVEAILAEHKEETHTDIAYIEFSGEKITFLDKDESKIAASDYKFVKKIGEGEEHGEFAIFEATGDVPEQFKVLALMEPHGGEGDITHFHVRYASSIDSEELTDSQWWPVYVDPNSTETQVINEILGGEHEHDHEH